MQIKITLIYYILVYVEDFNRKLIDFAFKLQGLK